MVAVKAHQAEAFLKPPGPNVSAILFYGSDAGLVSERAVRLAALIAGRDTPPAEIIRLDDADLDHDPDRLAIEAQTIPMFGGGKVIRAIAGRRVTAAVLEPLLEGGTLAATLIVEAGNLRPTDALRTLFEKATNAAAVACYADEAHDLETLIRETLSAFGLTISPDARELLLTRLGADRALSRGEVEKLALYASGKGEIDAADVEAIVGDASELAIDRVVNAAASGDAARAATEYARALAAGESPQTIIAAALRHLQRLHRIRAELDSGRSLDDALRLQRPPIHFKQKDTIALQCRTWTTARLQEAMAKTALAAKTARLSAALEEQIAERLVLGLAAFARGDRPPERRA
jgi:DNA polymerase-3 subunit delta